MNTDLTAIRRIDNKPLPELKLLNKKRKAENSQDLDKEDNNEEDIMDGTDSLFLVMKSEKDIDINWKIIQDEFKKINPNLFIVYMRFKEKLGHIGIFHNSKKELKFEDKLSVENNDFTIARCEGEELIQFYKEHGNHYEMCVKRIKREQKKKRIEKRPEVDTRLKTDVTLGGEM